MSGHEEIVTRPFDHPDVVALIVDIQAFYLDRYGSVDHDQTPPGEFAKPNGLFLVAYLDGVPVACGGWRRLVPGTAGKRTVEIKRMWVAESARGRGLARRVLAELERTALEAGAERMTLNTGNLQFEAIQLYESCGYEPTSERYGHYADFGGAHFFAKGLGAVGT